MQPTETEAASSAENAEPNAQLDSQATPGRLQEKPRAQPVSSAAEHAQPQPSSAGTASTEHNAEPAQASPPAAQPSTRSAEPAALQPPDKSAQATAPAGQPQEPPSSSQQQTEQDVGPYGGPYGGTVPLLLDTADFNATDNGKPAMGRACWSQ